ncbi:MAG TPA: hypothetical protein VHW70_14955 [Edaphobacter sp.]|nr:hypothetical protein [Edaphobacter sp.]
MRSSALHSPSSPWKTSILRQSARDSAIPPYCFDILQQIAGIDFATVYKNSEELLIDGDLPARYISAADLITNKLASGHLQDLADVEAIRHRQRAVERH